jgi:hypothetical protein
VGLYTISIITTTSQLSDTQTFTIDVVSDCTISTLTNRSFFDMITYVSETPDTQTLVFDDSVGTLHNDITYCGPRTYTFSPVYSFLSAASDTLTLSTANPGDVGVYTVTATIKLANYPMVPEIIKTFQVTINCVVQTLSFNANNPVSNQVIQIGIDTQPFSIPYSVTKFPLCTQTPTFTLNPSLSFLSNSPTGDSGNIIINGALPVNRGTYNLMLEATLDGQYAPASVQLNLVDPCETAPIVTIPASLSTMTINAPSLATSTQTYVITNNQSLLFPSLVCNYVASVSPSAAYLSLNPNQLTVSVDASKIVLPTDLGVHSFTIKITSVDYPTTIS